MCPLSFPMDSACICLTLSWETPRSRAISWSFLGGSLKYLSFITFFCLSESVSSASRRFSLARLSNPSLTKHLLLVIRRVREQLPVSSRGVVPCGTLREGEIPFGSADLHLGDFLFLNAEMVRQDGLCRRLPCVRQLSRVCALPLLSSGKAFSGTAWFRS